ncbi:MAG: hypothetical protein ACRCX8_11965 [Sarcina sp.]
MKYKLFVIGGILITILTGVFLYSFINEYKFNQLYVGSDNLKNDSLVHNQNKIIDREEAINLGQTLIEKYFHVNLNDGYEMSIILNNSPNANGGTTFVWCVSWQKPHELNPNYYFSIDLVGGNINGMGVNYAPKIYKNTKHILFNFNVAKNVLAPLLNEFKINMTPKNSNILFVKDGVFNVQIIENGWNYNLYGNYYTNQVISYSKARQIN